MRKLLNKLLRRNKGSPANSRISTAIICCIGVVSASLIINVLVGYYK